MAHRYTVNYEIRDKKDNDYVREREVPFLVDNLMDYLDSVGYFDDIQEREVSFLVDNLMDYLDSGGEEPDDLHVMSIIESKDLFLKITKIIKSTKKEFEKKIIDLILASPASYGSDLLGYSEDVHLGYADLNDKYLLLKRYFMAFKIALSKAYWNPAPSLIEEGDPNVLDSYLKWLEDLYKEINPKSKVPELSKDQLLRWLNYGVEGMMGNGEYAFGTYESDYNDYTKNYTFYPEAHPSSRFDFQPNNEESFKSRMKDILLNKIIYYTYSWE